MAITAPKCSSELGLLDLNFSKKHPEGISFSLPGMTKTSSEARTVFFASFPSANAICVTTTLDAYLTGQRRQENICPLRQGSQIHYFYLITNPTNQSNPALLPGGSKSLLGPPALTQRLLRPIQLGLPQQLRQEIKVLR